MVQADDSARPSQSAGLVHVLMSTHNGARFLEPQVRSILDQTWRNLRLIVRDDGSTDGTVLLLRDVAAGERDRVLIEAGPGLGATAGFFTLLYDFVGDAEYIAFADQDDVWLPDKVTRAVERLAALGPGPALYCARARVVDRQLNARGLTPLWPRPPSFGNALVENIAMGCTILLNRAAADLIRRAPRPDRAIMHDWWCYLVVSALGQVVFDPEPALLYRQHADNVVGVTASPVRRMVQKLRRQLRQDSLRLCQDQAQDFAARYGAALDPPKRDLLVRFLSAPSLGARMALARDHRLFRQFPLDDALLRLRLLPG